MDTISKNFHAMDFVIFFGMFLMSVIVGGFFGYRDRNRQSTDNYYFGDRKISAIPVSISIAVSFISAITVIGFPTEVYLFGNVIGWFSISLLTPYIVGVFYYVPLFHRLQLNSVYEYLELRFHRSVRVAASVVGILSTTVYLAIAVFLPSLALSAVTPLPLTGTIALTSVTCTLYTSLGGMKAVIWTDVMQSVIMVAGMTAVFASTVAEIGGLEAMFETASLGGRNNFLKLDIDPRIRSTTWTILIGGSMQSCYEIVCNQIYIQRWLACKTVNSARLAILLSAIPLAVFYVLSIGNGLAMYAYYEGCDPLSSGRITKPDQLVPRLAVDIFQNTPGMAGLFVSAAFCGTLSTVSSGINSLSAVALMDVFMLLAPQFTERKKMLIGKTLSIVSGVIVMLTAYIIALSSSNAIEIITMLTGFFAGPVLGMYTMGIFMPWINYKGALAGFVSGFAFISWIGILAVVSPSTLESSKKLPVSTVTCHISESNASESLMTTPSYSYETTNTSLRSVDTLDSGSLANSLYAISPFLYGTLGLISCLIGAHLCSIFLGFTPPSKANSDLFMPMIDNKCFPRAVRNAFRCGVPKIAEKAPRKFKQNYIRGKRDECAV